MWKWTSSFLLWILGTLWVQAQSDPAIGQNIFPSIPPSPEAAQQMKFVQQEVDLYRGLAPIQLPLIQFESVELSVPISLNYHPSGVKVEDRSSRVGIGWSLFAGGQINRTVFGSADELSNGYFSATAQQAMSEYGFAWNTNCSNNVEYDYLNQASTGYLDLEPDEFSLTLPQQNLSFLFNPQKEILPIEKTSLIIQDPFQNPGHFDQWVITDENGIKYYFGRSATGESAYDEIEVLSFCDISTQNSQHISSWYLMSMVSPSYQDTISFHYEPYTTQYSSFHGQTSYYSTNAPPRADSYCNPDYKLWGQRLTQISSKAGSVHFYYQDNRCDLPGDQTLSSIEYKDHQDRAVKKFIFHQSYWADDILTNPCFLAADRLKLRLDSIQEVGSYCSFPSHRFEYYGDKLPARTSKSQDHWGYYNGALNSTLIPAYEQGYYSLSGADKNPTLSFARLGSLKKWTYPTGGFSEYTYGLHTYGNIPPTYNTKSIKVWVDADADKGIHVDERSFTLLTPTYLTVNSEFENSSGLGAAGCRVNISGTGTNLNYTNSPSSTQKILLNPGSYTLRAEADTDCRTYFSLHWEESINPLLHKNAGGLRIEKILVHDGISSKNDMIREFSYISEGDSSSGVLLSNPAYEHFETFKSEQDIMGVCFTDGTADKTYLVRNSLSTINSRNASAQSVVYKNVTEYYGRSGAYGKKTYEYYAMPGYTASHPNGNSNSGFPSVPNILFPQRNGKLLSEKEYELINKVYYLRSETQYVYDWDDLAINDPEKYVWGIRIGKEVHSPCYGCLHNDFSASYYKIPSIWVRLTEKRQFKYSETASDEPNVDSWKYFYPTSAVHKRANEIWHTQSDGSIRKKHLLFSLDTPPYVGSHPSKDALQLLKDQNRLVLIEEWESIENDGIERVHLSKLNTFRAESFGSYLSPVLDSTFQWQNNLGITYFSPFNGIQKLSEYRWQTTLPSYDIFGLPSSINSRSSTLSSTLRSSVSGKIIASITNASPENVYVEGFEEDNTPLITYVLDAKTGKYSGVLNGNIIEISNKALSGKYTFSAYVKGAGSLSLPDQGILKSVANSEWTLISIPLEWNINTSSFRWSASAGVLVDEVRLLPQTTYVETFSYEKGNLLHTKTDANSISEYYLYDDLGRLIGIQNNLKEFVKVFKYQDFNLTNCELSTPTTSVTPFK